VKTPFRHWIGAAVIAVIAIGGPIIAVTTGGGGGGGNVAQIWVNTSAGASPSRCSPACAYDSTHAYGSLDAANDVCQNGDTVYVKGGTYSTLQTITGSNSRTSSCTIRAEPGGSSVDVNGVTTSSADYIDLSNMVNTQSYAGFFIGGGSDHVHFVGVTGAHGDIQAGDDVSISYSDFGPCTSDATYDCSFRMLGSNVTVDHDLFHDIGTSNAGLYHTEWIFVRGCTTCVISNSKFIDTTPQGILVQNCCSLGANDTLTIENNWFGAVYFNGSRANWNLTGTNVGHSAIEVDQSVANLIVRHNSMYAWADNSGNRAGGLVCFGDNTYGGQSGTKCGTDASLALVYGNIVGRSSVGCMTNMTASYNVWIPYSGSSLLTCGDATNAASLTVPYTNDPHPYTAGTDITNLNYAITGSTWTGDGMVSSPYCVPATDIAGASRTAPCDAGATER
jgi:hypothetical protein